jgi:succinate dehydrogenase/fumarate reductase flavoprotein subunit
MGYTTMQVLTKHVESIPSVQVKCKATVTKLLVRDLDHDRKQVYGVEYVHDGGQMSTIEADAVVLATGGYAFDRSPGSLLQQHTPTLCHLSTSSGAIRCEDL